MHQLVPHFILKHYAAGQENGEFPAAGMFVDISGFSAMTDALMEHGQHGAEVLAEVMRSAFEPLIHVVYEHGGFVAAHAGDSFTALFPLDAAPQQGMLNALAAAWAVRQRAIATQAQVTAYGRFAISIKVGLAAGEATWGIITSDDQRRAVYYFRGDAVSGCTEAEHRALPGEVILEEKFYAGVQYLVEAEPRDAYYHLKSVSVTLPPPRPLALPEPDPDLAGRFFPKNLLSASLAGEFRQVTYLFVGLPTVRTNAQLAIFMQSVFDLQDRYSGLLKLQFGDKGVHLLLIWGAPLAYENDIQRAVSFILDLQTQTTIPIIGAVTHHIAHAGYIGSELSEEYTAYGRGVNLAARFMTSAPRGEIWIDERVAQRVLPLVEVEFLGEKGFKGFAQGQKVYLLLERKEAVEPFFAAEMVGREAELAALDRFVRPVFDGSYAGALVVWGEPGMGKSRLLHEFLDRLKEGAPAFQFFLAQSDEILRQPLNPFRYWLRHYFGMSESLVDARNKRSFNRKLDELIAATSPAWLAEELDRTRSFLGALVGLHWPDSLYEQLEGEARRENTFTGLLNLLRAESLRAPVILFIEDIHLLDDDSNALLPRLLRWLPDDGQQSYPIAILLAARRQGAQPLPDGLPVVQIDLDRLPLAALAQLAEGHLKGPADQSLLDLLEARAEGNPFFATQIIDYLRDNGSLRQAAGGWAVPGRAEVVLPVDVQAMLVARLDHLAQDVKEVVQTAAVLGREFELRLLAQMLRDDPELDRKVTQAEHAAIWAALAEMRYIFRHALLRDAAYQMQLRARRQGLHALAVLAYEKVYAGRLEAQYGNLAYHAEQAGWTAKARHYLSLAGYAAQEAYQNGPAIDYFSRALVLIPDRERVARFDLLLAREKIYATLGKHDDCVNDLQALEALAQEGIDRGRQAALALRLADHAADHGEYDRAIQLGEQAILDAGAAEQMKTVLEAYVYISAYYMRYNQYPTAISYNQRGLELARQIGDRFKESQLYNNLGMISMEQRDLATARGHFETSLDIAQEAGILRGLARPLNNLGLVAGYQGDFKSALDYYEQSLAISRQIGMRSGEGIALGNLGWVAGTLGEYSKAREYTLQQLRIARESGDLFSEIYAQINLSAFTGALGEFHPSLQAAEEGLRLSRQSGECMAEAWALTYLGHSRFCLGELAGAAEAYQSALDIRLSQDQPLLATEPAAGLARVALASDDLPGAQQHLQLVLDYLDAGKTLDGTDEPLRVYLTCYLVLQAGGDPRAKTLLETAHTLLQARAANIPAQPARDSFLENIEYNRAILSAWQQFA
jgi:predicted ATPase/class 3 adenylate cyclase